jgi:multidrug resistance efflux pump
MKMSSARKERRDHPRIDLPLKVEARDRLFDVKDWSLTGFALDEAISGLNRHDYLQCAVFMGSDTAGVRFPATCEVVRVDADGAVAFRIRDMDANHVRFLHRIVDDWLAGQEPAFESLLLDMPVENKEQRKRQGQLKILRTATQAGLLAVLTLLALSAAARNIFAVRSNYAAVSTALVVVASPFDGRITYLAASDRVERGASVASIANYELDQRRRELEGERAELTSQSAQFAQRLAEYRGALTSQSAALAAQIEAVSRERSTRQERLTLALRDQQRCQGLIESGGCSRAEADNRMRLVTDSRAALADADARLADLTRRNTLNGQGLLDDDLRDNVLSPTLLESRITRLQEHIAEIEQGLDDMAASMVLTSPCDCLVAEWRVGDGSSVRAGDPVVYLSAAGDASVDALVSAERAHGLALGGKAEVDFANGESRDGRIFSIRYEGSDPTRYGLPAEIPGGDRLARVRIEIPDLDPAWRGMTAEAVLEAGWITRFKSAFTPGG